MNRILLALFAGLIVVLPLSRAAGDTSIEEVIRKLNTTRSVQGSNDIKSYPALFTAYLALESPPQEIGPQFNHTTIHAEMSNWTAVSNWAESNPKMAEAILQSSEKTLFGLPYGLEQLDSEFREADLVADIATGGMLRDSRFPYLHALDVIAAFGTAEAYRLLEADQVQGGLDMMMATIFVMRQACDREFLAEQLHSVSALSDLLANLRDLCWVYHDKIQPDQCYEIAYGRLPYLEPDRNRLFMPEGDRVVASALIESVFTDRGQSDPEQFARTFAAIQSRDAPLTRMGAAKRWAKIAEIHDSLDASSDRLTTIYDDWYRRWRIEEYDPLLDIKPEFDRTNPIRYAAVVYSMQNIQELFHVRNALMAAVNGTAMAVGLAGYDIRHGTYPADTTATYATFVRKSTDRDPFDRIFNVFKYRRLSSRFAIDTALGRIWVESGTGLLYSLGQDHEDGRGSQHTDDGASGDFVLWPPVKALQREQGLR